MRFPIAAAAFLALSIASSTAPAQPVVVVPPPIVDARAIAAANGIGVIYSLRLDEGVWKLEGRDLGGQYVYMRIDPNTGAIVSVNRGWW